VTFLYDHRTKNIQNTAQGDIVAAAGSFQSEQGCPATVGDKGDWAPECLRAWLGDPDGDKVFTWTGTDIPKGDYEVKIALNRAWKTSYGDGGGSANIKFSVPADGLTVQFRWDSRTTGEFNWSMQHRLVEASVVAPRRPQRASSTRGSFVAGC
jgi:hypothetical protein